MKRLTIQFIQGYIEKSSNRVNFDYDTTIQQA